MKNLSRRDFLAAGAAAPLAAQAQAPPNVLVLVADDMNPDLGCYGDAMKATPNLDRLAAGGLRFAQAHVTSPQCSPSRSSMFTGRWPHANGCSRLHAPLPQHEISIVELLRERGYFTGAFRKHHLGPGFQKRLDYYGDARQPWNAFFDRLPAVRPFFLWVGFTDPHRRYSKGAISPAADPARVPVPRHLPDTRVVREDLALYYEEISRMDRESGEVLAEIDRRGLAANTLVFFVGDNGKPFPRAKCTLYDAGTRVPLIANWPGRIQAGAKSELISLIDLAPTILEAAGVPPPATFQSRSFLPLLLGRDWTKNEAIFTERNWHDNLDLIRAVRTSRYKLIRNFRPEVPYRPSLDLENSPSWVSYLEEHKAGRLPQRLRQIFAPARSEVELYDLANDPDELENVAALSSNAAVLRDLQQRLASWMEATNDFLPPPGRRRAQG